jgi:hypothetical protein
MKNKIAVYTVNMDNEEAFKALNNSKCLSKTLFFDNVRNKPENNNFGLFNSTEILNYTNGVIVTDFLSGVSFISKVSNVYPNNCVYLYNSLDKNLIKLMECVSDGVTIACLKKDESELKRKIGETHKIILVDNLTELLAIVG